MPGICPGCGEQRDDENGVPKFGRYCPNCDGSGVNASSEEVLVESIIIGERFRKAYRNIEELAESIRLFGLLQYPVLDQDNNLIAGGRRMEAIKSLGWNKVRIVRKKNISGLKLREMELEENLQRENLTWQEEVALRNEITRLKQEMYGIKGAGGSSEGVSQAEIAEELGVSPATLSMDLALGMALAQIPELAKCKTKGDAHKILLQLQEKCIVQELSKRRQATTVSSKFKEADESFKVGDLIEGLRSYDGPPLEFVNCDTPYGIDLNNITKTKNGELTKHAEEDYTEWTPEEYVQNCLIIASELYRITKPDCFMTWWFGIQWYDPLKEILQAAGWNVGTVPNIWFAKGPAQSNQPEFYLGNSYEPFFICWKGKPIIFQRGRSNVFEIAKVTGSDKIHRTEKPVELYEELYRTYAPPGAYCADVPCGSGAGILSAIKSDRHCIGWDLSENVKKKFLLKADIMFK